MTTSLTPAQLEARRRGGQARARAFTPEHQSRASKAHRPEDRAAWGRLGWAALVAKKGDVKARRILANWRKAHPSKHEARLIRALNAICIDFERETEFGRYFADFYFPQTNTVVEVDTNWHNTKADAKRDAAMRRRGLRVVRLNGCLYALTTDPDALRAVVFGE